MRRFEVLCALTLTTFLGCTTPAGNTKPDASNPDASSNDSSSNDSPTGGPDTGSQDQGGSMGDALMEAMAEAPAPIPQTCR
jgi:hypothetical protein